MLAPSAENHLLRLGERAPLLSLQLRDGLIGLVFPLVAEAFVEHEGQNVVLVILPGGLAAENVGGTPEMGFKLLLRKSHADISTLTLLLYMRCSKRSRE